MSFGTLLMMGLVVVLTFASRDDPRIVIIGIVAVIGLAIGEYLGPGNGPTVTMCGSGPTAYEC